MADIHCHNNSRLIYSRQSAVGVVGRGVFSIAPCGLLNSADLGRDPDPGIKQTVVSRDSTPARVGNFEKWGETSPLRGDPPMGGETTPGAKLSPPIGAKL